MSKQFREAGFRATQNYTNWCKGGEQNNILFRNPERYRSVIFEEVFQRGFTGLCSRFILSIYGGIQENHWRKSGRLLKFLICS